jgi:hypothetical protein
MPPTQQLPEPTKKHTPYAMLADEVYQGALSVDVHVASVGGSTVPGRGR